MGYNGTLMGHSGTMWDWFLQRNDIWSHIPHTSSCYYYMYTCIYTCIPVLVSFIYTGIISTLAMWHSDHLRRSQEYGLLALCHCVAESLLDGIQQALCTRLDETGPLTWGLQGILFSSLMLWQSSYHVQTPNYQSASSTSDTHHIKRPCPAFSLLWSCKACWPDSACGYENQQAFCFIVLSHFVPNLFQYVPICCNLILFQHVPHCSDDFQCLFCIGAYWNILEHILFAHYHGGVL